MYQSSVSLRTINRKCLTVKQPWAWALIHGPKRIENRTWYTSYRGPLFIHAGKGRDRLGEENGLFECDYKNLIYWAIIGVVDLVDCVPIHQAEGDPFAEGPWCWLTANPKPLNPFYCSGALSLWLPPKELMIPHRKIAKINGELF